MPQIDAGVRGWDLRYPYHACVRYAAPISTSLPAMRSVPAVKSVDHLCGPARSEASEEATCMRVITDMLAFGTVVAEVAREREKGGSPFHLAQFILPIANANGRDVGFGLRIENQIFDTVQRGHAVPD